METEDQGSLPFLDVRITKATDGHLTHQVYRKPMHTDRYLHYRSFHHPSVLQSVSSTLIKRAHDFSDKQHLQQELQHIKSTLTTINGYPNGKIKVRPPIPQPTTPAPTRVTIPYMGKTSHKLQRILKTVNIEVRHRSSNKLHSTTSGRGQISHRETRTTTTTQHQLGRQQPRHIHSTLAYQTSSRSHRDHTTQHSSTI